MPDHALSPSEVGALTRDRDRRKFADFARLHANDRRFVSRDNERMILKSGIADFGMDYDEAHGVLLGVAAEQKLALESQAEQNVRAFLEHKARKKKISRKEFKEAAAMYRQLVNDGLTRKEAKQRVKAVMMRCGLRPKRIRLLFLPLPIPGARRWYNRIRV
jgi:hypothetical protein